jgi:acetylornithine deacetylase/succinyl-diaminopimelate desuccinylase-like protein
MSVSRQELEAFFDYLRFPSISASPEHTADTRACAVWLCDHLSSMGLSASVRETGGAPVVVAQTAPRSGAPTVLLYGHYDVQPADPVGLWATPPFEPAVRGGFIHARGATDNKGQTFSHLIGLRRMLETGPLPVNLVVLVEGEEEIGSPHLGEFIRANRELLACDAVLISDTSMVEPGWPALTLGLRGIACFEAVVHGPKADLHSGMFGGATPNPALALSRILARMHDSRGRIAIPGLYDDVVPTPEEELTAWKLLPWDEGWFARTTGVAPTAGEAGVAALERVWARPTAEINGLTSGHQGAGSKTIIPAVAKAKLSFRLAPRQDPDHVADAVKAWFERELSAEGLDGEIEYDHGGLPFYTPADSPFIAAARAALTEVFGQDPALTREGLSIPVAALLQDEFRVPVVLAGLGLPDCNAHSPNESYPLAHLDLGAQTFAAMMQRFAIAR